uniref:Sulfotransferase n=2 Tax=Tetraselmis sp. GSL018 TaxID=582737 RepID=A0A061S2I2_9CHLO
MSRKLPRGSTTPQGGREVPEDVQDPKAWYQHFPRCEPDDNDLLIYPGSSPTRLSCQELSLPPIAEKYSKTQAPSDKIVVNTTFPGYVFMLGTAYGGTTALLGLLSSSPQVAVPNSGWAHEAHWKLISSNVYPFLKRSGLPYGAAIKLWNLRYDPTIDLEEMDRAWTSAWDATKPVRVDKSHSLIAIYPQLYHFYRAKGSSVKFIVLVRHPCTFGAKNRVLRSYLSKLRNFRRVLEDFPNDSLLIRFEDFVRDPKAVADRILNFLPELERLDPAVSNLMENKTRMRTGNADRGMATGGENQEELLHKYITSRMSKPGFMGQFHLSWCEGFPAGNKAMSSEEALSLLRFFGWLE